MRVQPHSDPSAEETSVEPNIEEVLRGIASEYPPALVKEQLADVDRIAFHIRLIRHSILPTASVICDVGGGVGLLSLGCAALGMNVFLVDDFNDEINHRFGSSLLDLHRSYGVELINTDVIATPPTFPPNSLDAITSFAALEHFHHSPKRLLHKLVDSLTTSGVFVLGTPNCANLRKRIMGLVGKAKWSDFAQWYEPDIFRGHVREPDVGDLRRIAEDLGLRDVRVFGKNWIGHQSPNRRIRVATRLTDPLLQRRAGLCSDIYVIGVKP